MVNVKVYGDPRATCTQRVLILLEELDLKYDIQNVDLMKGEQKSEDYLKLHPFGKVPSVEYDDRVLFESRSILRYISKNNTDIKNLYNDIDVDIWLEVESQNYNPPASKIVYEKVFKAWKGDKPDNKIVKRSVEELERVLDVYEKRLEVNPYLAGNDFSIADISHIPYTNYLLKCGYKELYKRRPNVYKWLKRIIKRDSVQYLLNETTEENKQENDDEINKKEYKQKEEILDENNEGVEKKLKRSDKYKKESHEKDQFKRELRERHKETDEFKRELRERHKESDEKERYKKRR